MSKNELYFNNENSRKNLKLCSAFLKHRKTKSNNFFVWFEFGNMRLLKNTQITLSSSEASHFESAFSSLARQANINIVISDDIDANRRLTMTLNGVPWREALDVIVRATGYAYIEQEYQIIRVVSQDKLVKDLRTKILRKSTACLTYC